MEFDGEAYAKRGIILVTAAYRLGVLGFLLIQICGSVMDKVGIMGC